jgi:ADP-L-glycero-D-manno-heptose 6-epimerase
MKSWPEQRVLVTGGAGFIGSALVWALNLRGCERVVVCDRLGADEKWRNLTPLRFEDYLEADDLRQRLTAGATGNFDTVFHLGACSSTTELDAAFLIRNNYEFTKDLAAWSLKTGARFVYASSAATYGDGAQGMSDMADLDTLRPLNMYGYSKHLFDLHAKRAGFLDQIVGLKYFNVFGPNEDHKGEMRSLVHKATSQARQEGVIRLFKSYRPDFRDGEQQRDFLYVKDAVAMTLHLASTPSAAGLFNLGSGAARTWIDLANAVFASLACPPRIEFIEMPEQLRGKYQYHTCADLAKLRHSGFDAPLTQLEEAVRDYVQSYLLTGVRLGDGEHESSSARRP